MTLHLDLLGNASSGGNCYLLSTPGDTLMLDAGLAWSQDREIGVDFTVPRLAPDQKTNLDTLVVTHPHEDHIGALPYLLRQLPGPPHIAAGPVTAAIIRQRLSEAKIDSGVESLGAYAWGRSKRFRYQMLPVPHSASESMAVYIEGEGKGILYSGDLRGSDETGYGSLPSNALRQHSGVDFLLLEAVRADVDEMDPTLADLKEGLLSALHRLAGRRIIVSAFSSNLTRIQIIIELAQSVGRQVYLLGRSMRNAVETAQQFGRMPKEAWTLGPPPKEARDSTTLILVAGAQGEPDAGLSRLIRGHYPVQARKGDGLIMSSTPIPGNEAAFWLLVEAAIRKGVEVITYRDHLVHLSGHSTASELQRIMRVVRPKAVIPFHGDYYRHAVMREIGRRAGLSPQAFVPASNGDRVWLRSRPSVEHVNWPVDAYQLAKGRDRHAIPIGERVLEERRRMLNSGAVVISVGNKQPAVTCVDCPDEVETFVAAQRPLSRQHALQQLRMAVEQRFAIPPVVIDAG